MFGRWLRSAKTTSAVDGREALQEVVRRELPDADDETVLVVAAIAGLLGAIAYADRSYGEDEERRVRSELARVHGMTEAGIDAVCSVLRQHVVEMSTVQAPRHCRSLVELCDRELRVDVLETLVELAAADGGIDNAEVNALRLITTALGLSQNDYNAAQAKHVERLKVLG
ncbi:MAG TPA: TerB family tellurite resistance protein [Polyangiaceae bacterium]